MLESSLIAMGWAVSNWLIAAVRPEPMGNENVTASPSGPFRTGAGLLNIAGISGRDPKLNIQTSPTAGPRLGEQSLEHWNWVMEINATGVFLGTRAAIPAMQRAGGGSRPAA